jgi:uncharacterized membrane protein
MNDTRFSRLRAVMRIALAIFFIGGLFLHLNSTDALVRITPDWVPWPREAVLITGWLEIAGAIGLLWPRTRRLAGIALAVYIVAVWPANMKHAFEHIVLPTIPDSWWYHGPRLLLQPVLAWCSLFAAGVIDWPARR